MGVPQAPATAGLIQYPRPRPAPAAAPPAPDTAGGNTHMLGAALPDLRRVNYATTLIERTANSPHG